MTSSPSAYNTFTMVVSMIQLVVALYGVTSIKEKRRVIKSLRDRIMQKFHVSAAEVDLQESLSFGQLGAAVVSNSKQHGEQVMQGILTFVEHYGEVRVEHVEIHSEVYG
ncbi:MAG: DUF503 domain-containing protein [Alkalispirochaetaceae bacterium]